MAGVARRVHSRKQALGTAFARSARFSRATASEKPHGGTHHDHVAAFATRIPERHCCRIGHPTAATGARAARAAGPVAIGMWGHAVISGGIRPMRLPLKP